MRQLRLNRWAALFLLFACVCVSAQSQATVELPIVGCESDGQTGPLAAPKGRTIKLAVNPKMGLRLAVHKAEAGPAVLAPRGWACFGRYGSAGASITVAPMAARRQPDQNSEYVVEARLIDGDTSGRFTVADIIGRVFPAHRSLVDRVISEHLVNGLTFPEVPFPADRLTYRSNRVVEYQTPGNSKGMGTYFLTPNPRAVRGVTMLTSEFSVRHLAIRLPREMGDIESTIVEQFEAGPTDPWRDVTVPPGANAKLAFSPDGRYLYAIGDSAVTYDVSTGRLINRMTLKSGTEAFSIASDGTTAILAERDSGQHVHLILFDFARRKLEPVPSAWYDAVYDGPNAALSADGKLFSIYSESGPSDRPMTVTVYDRSSGKIVGKQTSEFISAGGAFSGGITPDGAVEFENNRAGRKVVDLKTGRLIGRFSFASVRSPDGMWVVEFPNRTWNESAAKDAIIKDGRNGNVIGRLALQIEDDEAFGSVHGAFCGTAGRFIVGRGRAVTVHAIPSGAMIAYLPVMSWQQKNAHVSDPVYVACSAAGTQIAVLSGNRLTLHNVRDLGK